MSTHNEYFVALDGSETVLDDATYKMHYFWVVDTLVRDKEIALMESAGCISEEESETLAYSHEQAEFDIERAKTEVEIDQIVAALKLSLNSL